MGPKALSFVDSHVHLDHILRDNPERIEWMIKVGCMPVSWSWSGAVSSVDDIRAYLEGQLATMTKIREAGLPCYFLAGIHPRDITPDLEPGMVFDMIMPYVEDPLCLGVGEIGLETGGEREKEIFAAQLEVAAESARFGKVAGVHTPREDKERILELTLPILRDSGVPPEHVVVDHCNARTVADVLDAGYYAGITVSPIKSSLSEIAFLARGYEGDEDSLSRIMANTDSGTEVYEDLFRLFTYPDLSREDRDRLCLANALRFYGLGA
ncbi:MAG: TatD family hydrolase [Desulfatibacillaceae bacterium]